MTSIHSVSVVMAITQANKLVIIIHQSDDNLLILASQLFVWKNGFYTFKRILSTRYSLNVLLFILSSLCLAWTIFTILKNFRYQIFTEDSPPPCLERSTQRTTTPNLEDCVFFSVGSPSSKMGYLHLPPLQYLEWTKITS